MDTALASDTSTRPAAQVPRTRLCERACAATSVRLVVVRAAAGFGKTTTLMQMHDRLDAEGTATAWWTLDRADNDVPRFLRGLAAAVATLTGQEHLGPSAPADLLQRLAAQGAPFVLFLDDVECLQEPAVLGLVRELIDHLPRGGRIALGARSQPDLGLGRLRARGQLLEIDSDDLRFTLADTEAYFALRPHLQLSAEALRQLHHKTEGWAAAIALSAVALQRQPRGSDFVARFSGSNRAVAAYLAEAVLAQQPPEVRQFLLHTSVLRQFDVSLCSALMPDVDAVQMVERLEADNLFITPHADEHGRPGWRYHALFADFLRAQLAREQPARATRLHLAASGWYESQGLAMQAIEHAMEGGDQPCAAALLMRHAESFIEQGRMRLLARWLSALRPSLVQATPLLQVASVWAACFTRGPAIALELLRASACEASHDPVVRAHVAALLPLLHALLDRYDEALPAGRQGLAALPSCRPFADIVLSNTMAHVLSVMGEPAESHRLLDMARRTASGSSFTRPFTESMEGLLDLHEGRIRQAAARLRLAAGNTHGDSYNHVHGNAWAGVLYASVVYEQDQLDAAQHLLNLFQPMVRDVALPDHMILSHVLGSRIAYQRGDIDGAQAQLTELEYLGHHRRLPRVVAAAGLERARLLLMQGHALASREALALADSPGVWARVRTQRLPSHDLDDLAIGHLRWELTFGDARAAVPTIEAELVSAHAANRQRRALKLRLLKAMAQYRGNDIAGALQTLDGVVRQASHEGFVRLLLDEGPALAPMLQRLQASPTMGACHDPILGDHVQRLVRSLGGEAAAATPEPAALGSLTRQEVRVLQLLAEGYSNGAMAEKLQVADSTVRTHLRAINLKLNAHNRTQAVAAARRLTVIR